MEGNELVTLFLGGGGLGALFAVARWYLKERMQRELDRRSWEQEVQKRRDELRTRQLEHEQQAINAVFERFGRLSDRMSDLIFELMLEPRSGARVEIAETAGQEAGDHVD